MKGNGIGKFDGFGTPCWAYQFSYPGRECDLTIHTTNVTAPARCCSKNILGVNLRLKNTS